MHLFQPPLLVCSCSLPVSPLVEVVVVLGPLDVDQLLVLLLVGFTARDGVVLHVPQGLP